MNADLIRVYLCNPRLKPEPQGRPDDIQIARYADAVILPEIVVVLREVFVEDFAHADRETIPHPAIDGPVVEHFIRRIQR